MGLLTLPAAPSPAYAQVAQTAENYSQQPSVWVEWMDNKGAMVPAGMMLCWAAAAEETTTVAANQMPLSPTMIQAMPLSPANAIICPGTLIQPMQVLPANVNASPAEVAADGVSPPVLAEVVAAPAAPYITETAPQQMTPALKELKKQQKKLREIAKIEALQSSDTAVDKKQLEKLNTKEQVQRALEKAQQAFDDEKEQEARLEDQPRTRDRFDTEEIYPEYTVPAVTLPDLTSSADASPRTRAASPEPWPAQIQPQPQPHCQPSGVYCPHGQPYGQQWQMQELYHQGLMRPQPQWTYVNWEYSQMGDNLQPAPAPCSQQQPQVVRASDTGRHGRRNRGAQPRQQQAQVPKVQQGQQQEDFPSWQKLMQQFDSGEIEQKTAIESLRGQIVNASLDKEGCRVVQKGLTLPTEWIKGWISELRGHISDLIHSPYGNFVVQQAIEHLPTNQVIFVATEMRNEAKDIARNRFGCRIYCRLLEHCSGPEGELSVLINELLEGDVAELCKHPFAHHAIHAILEHGTEEQRRKIGNAILENPWRLVNHKHSSHVVEAFFNFEQCPLEIQQQLLQELLYAAPDRIAELAQKRYGGFVVRALFAFARHELSCEDYKRALAQLTHDSVALRANMGKKSGSQRLLEELAV